MFVSAHPIRWSPSLLAFLLWTLPVQQAPAQSPGSDQTHGSDQTPGSDQTQAASNAQPSDPQTRPCVLLKNDNVLFGQARQLGEFIIIQTGPNDELKIPRSQVACWAKSPADLYRYRLDHRSTNDFNSHLIDARWCLRYELFDLAEHEIQMAKSRSPNNREVLMLEGQLSRRRQPIIAQSAPDPTIATAAFLKESFPTNDGDANRVDPITLEGFASHVHTTLLNRCASCHNQESDLNWRLTVPSRGTRPTARITRENLTASLPFVDRANPDKSPLLIMATSPHGGVDAPLNARNAKAIEALQLWLTRTANFEPASRLGIVDRPAPSDANVSDANVSDANVSDAMVSDEPISSIAQVAYTAEILQDSSKSETNRIENAVLAKPTDAATDPQRLPTVANPFDPSLFNRRFRLKNK